MADGWDAFPVVQSQSAAPPSPQGQQSDPWEMFPRVDVSALAQSAAKSFRDIPEQPSANDGGRSFTLDSANIPQAAHPEPVQRTPRVMRGGSMGNYGALDAAMDYATGDNRTEFKDAKEFTPALVEATNKLQPAAMRSAVTPDQKAQLDILKSNYPDLESKTDKYGNVMLKAPGMTEWAYLNKPGLSERDFDEFGTQTLVTLPFTGLFGAGRSILGRAVAGGAAGGAGSVTQDLAAMAQGSEQGIDPTRAAFATGLGAVLGPVLGSQAKPSMPTPRTEAIEAANRQGIKIPVAAASDNFATQATAGAIKEIPYVGSPLVTASKEALDGIDAKAAEIATNLGSSSELAAGNALKDDLVQWMKFGSETEADKLFSPVGRLIGKKTGTLDNAENMISTLVGRSSAAGLEAPKIVDTINKAVNEARSMGGMTFDGMKTLRSEIGKRLSGDIVPEPGLDKAALKSLYGALTDDMAKLAGRQGSRARVAWENAVDLFKKDIVTRRDALEKVLGETGAASPESIVKTLRSMASTGKGADFTRLLQVKRTLGQRSWDELSSAIVSDLGRTPDGFSMAHFRSAYDKLSTPGKHALFSPQHRQALDDLALMSKKFVAIQKLGNPSGSARTALIATSVPTAIVSAVMAPTTAALGGASLAASNVIARILARPATAKAASKWANAYLMASTSKNKAAMAVFQQAERSFLNAMRDDEINVDSSAKSPVLPN